VERRNPKGEDDLKIRILALGLIVVGGLGLLYGASTHTAETHEAAVGPDDPSVKDSETVHFPDLAGVIALLLGGGLLFSSGKKSNPLVRPHG
jgi:hypothetical protein